MIRAMPLSVPLSLERNAKRSGTPPAPTAPSEGWTDQNHHIWIDVLAPSAQELTHLRTHFTLNALALQDALQVGHWSRFEAYPEHITLILRTLAEPKACTERTERVSYFWFPHKRALLTLRLEPVDHLEHIWKEMLENSKRSAEHIIAVLLSRSTDTFFEYTDTLEDTTDQLEEDVFLRQSEQSFTRAIFQHKHQIMEVRRLVSSARESISSLARHTSNQDISFYFRDAVDSLNRVYDTLDSCREVLSSILDIHLTVQSNRMNEVMKILTTVSTIFLPLTFLAGMWGMNFDFMPELKWHYGYTLAWVVMIGVGIGLALYFKKRHWW